MEIGENKVLEKIQKIVADIRHKVCYTIIDSYTFPYKGGFPLKYLRGYFTAGILGAIVYVLSQYGQRFSTLVDMIYPYVDRTLQGYLATWSGQVSFCLWQLLAVAAGVVVLASLVLLIVLKWNPIQWAGWVLAAGVFVYLLNVMMFGLNYYAGDLADDIRLNVAGYTLGELKEATRYYRDNANKLAAQVARDGSGNVVMDEFETLAQKAGEGFDYLTYKRYYPIFAGSKEPVKKLGWADMYSSMGITGFTCGITGEAAVNPQIPATTLPFTMCHEMAHRMCIASERDANFTGFLACAFHSSPAFQYSGYFMAYRYCISALATVRTQEAVNAYNELVSGASEQLLRDMKAYDAFFQTRKSDSATELADKVNDTYLKASGEKAGIASYGQVCDILVNWYIQEVVIPSLTIEESVFDPYDESQVDLSGIVNAR